MPLTGDYEPTTSRRSRKQIEQYEATDGRKGGDLRGKPVIVLTSVGAKTGKLRKTPLMRVEHDGSYAVVASLGGAPKQDYTAREVTGDEKVLWWDRAVEAWPDYAKYKKKTDRDIPVFVLESRDA